MYYQPLKAKDFLLSLRPPLPDQTNAHAVSEAGQTKLNRHPCHRYTR
jgi:hypothetical protein